MNPHTEDGGHAVDSDLGSLGLDEVMGAMDALRFIALLVIFAGGLAWFVWFGFWLGQQFIAQLRNLF